MHYIGYIIGYAIIVVFELGNEKHLKNNPNAWTQYREYATSLPDPEIVVVKDFDKPFLNGSFWGEVNCNMHKALGCIGTFTDGGFMTMTK